MQECRRVVRVSVAVCCVVIFNHNVHSFGQLIDGWRGFDGQISKAFPCVISSDFENSKILLYNK